MNLSIEAQQSLVNPHEKWPRHTAQYFKPMTDEGTKLFAQALLVEMDLYKSGRDAFDFNIPKEDRSMGMEILLKRIEVLKLPIKFSPLAMCAMEGLVANPGGIVTVLIDCLCKFPNETIDVAKLTEVYPWGFYSDKVFDDYVDNYLKPKKSMWSVLY
jgi:hypothetical protein